MNSIALKRHQQGATLIVALILLLILTVIGVAGMQDTTMQEKMVGNMRDRNLAFQAAEAALRGGEKYLQSATLPGFNNSGGLLNSLKSPYDPTKPGYTGRLRSGDPAFWESYFGGSGRGCINYSTISVYNELSVVPCYTIEEVPTVFAPPGESIKLGALKEIKSYRVTARATGGSTDAVVILQSTYRRQGGL